MDEMERKTIKTEIGDRIDFDASPYGQEESRIIDVISLLHVLQNEGATHLEWTGRSYDGDSMDACIQGYNTRPENDEEYSIRMKSIKSEKRKKNIASKKRDLSEYKRLKRKFEGD